MLVVFALLALLVTSGGSTTKSPEEKDQILTQTLGWVELVSEPVPIIRPEGKEVRDNIGLMEIQFRSNDFTYIALVNPYVLPGGISPLAQTGNKWMVGGEVYIVTIPESILHSRIYLAVDYRAKAQQ